MTNILTALLVLVGGTGGRDTLDVIIAEHYFESRKIQPKVATLLEMARTEPRTGKDQVRQLLAIRWLGENRVEQARETLRPIAAGKHAQDAAGFARDYAQEALARIDGRPVPRRTMPPDSLREGMSWFPADADLFGAIDFRGCPQLKELLYELSLSGIGIGGPRIAQEDYFAFLEYVGNVQLDRVAFAAKGDPDQWWRARFMFRCTGRGDLGRVARWLQVQNDGLTKTELKQPDSETILVLHHKATNTGLAILGNTELLLGIEMESQADVIGMLLEVRAGKKASLVKSRPAQIFQDLTPDSFVFLRGEFPKRTDVPLVELHMKAGPVVSLFVAANFKYKELAQQVAGHVQLFKGLIPGIIRDEVQRRFPSPLAQQFVLSMTEKLKRPSETLQVKVIANRVEVRTEIPVEVFTLLRLLVANNR
jgi:hypothetical protein